MEYDLDKAEFFYIEYFMIVSCFVEASRIFWFKFMPLIIAWIVAMKIAKKIKLDKVCKDERFT